MNRPTTKQSIDSYYWKNVSGYTAVAAIILFIILHFSKYYSRPIIYFFLILSIIDIIIFLISQFVLLKFRLRNIKNKKDVI